MAKAKEKYIFFQKGPPWPPENDKSAILEILKIEKNLFSGKILHRMKKVKKTDPPKTTQKTYLIDWAKLLWKKVGLTSSQKMLSSYLWYKT